VVVGLLVGGLLLAALAYLGATGFQDPTADTFAVTLRNDTAAPVLLKQCDVKCNEFHEQHRLGPGGIARANTGIDSPNWWLVQDNSGKVLGCLKLLYHQREVGAVVNVSAVTLCPT
jgi:hypothetical protein